MSEENKQNEALIYQILQFRQKTVQNPITYSISPMGIEGATIGSASVENRDLYTLHIGDSEWKLDFTVSGLQGKAQILDGSGAAIGSFTTLKHESANVLERKDSYDYLALDLTGQFKLSIYEVARGEEGHFWCVYTDDEHLAGMIRKTVVTKDSLDIYELFMDDTKLTVALCLLALYIDATRYARVEERGFNRDTEFTTSNALLDKYDPNFIQRIRSEFDQYKKAKPVS